MNDLCLQPSPMHPVSCLCTPLFTPPHSLPPPGNLSPTHIPSHLSSHGLPKLPTFPSTYPLTPAASNHASTHSPNSLLTHPLSLSLPIHMPIHSYSYLHPGTYPSCKVYIWVPVQLQREPWSPWKPQTHHTQLQKEQHFFLEVSML